MGYQLMFYGGLAGAVITLPVAIYLFIKLDMVQVLEDLTGIRLRKANKRNKYRRERRKNTSGELTSSEIRLKKKDSSFDERDKNAPIEAIEQTSHMQETELIGETTLLSNQDETVLLTDTDSDFIIEEDIVIVHSSTVIKDDQLIRG